MSDVTYLSPSRLATYATCPRQYEYRYDQEIATIDRTELYLNQGRAYHEAIEQVCAATDPGDDAAEIYDRALAAFDECWAANFDADEYASRSHAAYQRAENLAGIEAFFDPEDGEGIEHARRSIATETWVECARGDIGLRGIADNILRTDDGLHVIDYKRNLRGVISSYTADRLVDHLDGEAHEATRVKNTFQTAAYLEGVKNTDYYDPGMTVRFSFYGLLHKTDHESTPDGYTVTASGSERDTTEIYADHEATIWQLIEAAHRGITDRTFTPAPFELLQEEACPDCDYREMCPDRLGVEVER